MTLTPVDLLARIIAAHSRHLRRFDTLTVQRSGRWVLMATSLPTQLSAKRSRAVNRRAPKVATVRGETID